MGHSSATKEKVKYTAIFTLDHRHGTIYHHFDSNTRVQLDNLYAFPSDQMVLARLLADRQACIVHAGGLILDGKGLLFIGHSEAGKTTLLKMAPSEGEILCDDRIIIRCWPDGIRIHGTWSHGDLPDVSPASAPLTAVFYLEKTETNQIIPITDKMARLGKLTSFLIRPFATSEWWTKTIDLAFRVSTEIPAYRLQFDKSGEVFDILKKIR